MCRNAKGIIIGIALMCIIAWISGPQAQASEWDGYDTTIISTGEVLEESSNISAEEGLVRAGGDYISITEEEACEAIWTLASDYPEGMIWTNDTPPAYWSNIYIDNVHQGGCGCHGFALIVSDKVFDHNPARRYEDYTQLRVGDVLRINNDTHTVVVLENHLEEGYIVVTEGNYAGTVHWGRRISKSTLDNGFVYGISRYVDDNREQVWEFAKRMYEVALERTAAKNELKYWTDQLVYHESDGAGVAKGFIMSDELAGKNLDDGRFVNMLYRTFFGREAGGEEIRYWVDNLEGGHSRYYVFCGFANSGEFDKLCADYGILRGYLEQPEEVIVTQGVYDFVRRNYELVLERNCADNEIRYWVDKIAGGEMTPETVAMQFFFSDEYIGKNKSDTEYICTLYRTFLNREPAENELHYYRQVIEEGASRETLLLSFSRSEEFQNIMRGFGL